MRSLSISRALLAGALGIAFMLGAGIPDSYAQQQRQSQPRPAAKPSADTPAELPPAGTAMVVVDVAKILREASAMQALRTQADKHRQAFQADMQKLEGDLRNADQDLARQRAILAPEAFAQRRREFDKRVADAQQEAQERRRRSDQAFNAAMQKVQDVINQVVLEIVEERRYQVVLPRANIIASQTALDITGEVMRRLNRKLPTMAVNIPKD
jgi:outer membrane protein